MGNKWILRKIRKEDCMDISEAFKKQGWDKPVAQYQKYVEFQEEGKRGVIVAEVNGEFAGYLTIKWESEYLPFKEKKIPEVVDFNVLMKFQRKGIGTALMNEAERRIGKVSNYSGIGFGVYKDYGAAQILYVNRHYVPDGNGLVKNFKTLEYGEEVIVNDDLAFYLIKRL
ncbi:MAG: GNAT family N-acetyltransferase [Chitinophagales bacterium]